MKKSILLLLSICFSGSLVAQEDYKTYCNPLDLDYTYMIYDAHRGVSYRSGADPAVVEFRDDYYMFVTRSMGYWYSDDLKDWEFIKPEKWYFQGSNAPAAFNYKDSLLYVAGDPSGSMSILYTDTPKVGDWKGVPAILNDLQDPALFIDDDGQAYMYWGSSNVYPIRGKKLDRKDKFAPGEEKALFNLHPKKHGWERFGMNHSDSIHGYMEGAWMTKHNGKYYLQYAAPGTEFNVYGDGAYVSDDPLGPFKYMPNNPFSYKPGGFINGAGHGSTVKGPEGNLWHFATMSIADNIRWERRIGMFRTFFDQDGLLHSDTYFGDYPHYLPGVGENPGKFVGWMLLSYDKPVEVSSVYKDFEARQLVDENIQSSWIAKENNDEQWVEIDLQDVYDVYAVQINYSDYESDMYGRLPDLYHRYTIEASVDGEHWNTIIDKSDNLQDVPNDYVELENPKQARYIRYENIHVPTPYLAVSGLRIFGKGHGEAPEEVEDFEVEREADRRNAMITWEQQEEAQGYNVLWGIAPDKLYSSWMVYDEGQLRLKSLGVDQTYYFAIEAFNENGISKRSPVVKIE